MDHFTEADRVNPKINLLLREQDNETNIYLARYNMYNLDAEAENMFNNGDYDKLYTFLTNNNNGVDVVRLGYFSLSLNLHEETKMQIEHEETKMPIADNESLLADEMEEMEVDDNEMSKYDYTKPILNLLLMEPTQAFLVLTTDKFGQFYMNNDLRFRDFFHFILKKVQYEMFLRQKQEIVFSVDLYYNRQPDKINKFHYDSDPFNNKRSVSFFSLSYIMPPNILMKGLSIISKNIDYYANQPMLTLVVNNGSSLCLDNNYFYHATPSQIVGTRPIHGDRPENIMENFSAATMVPGQGEIYIPHTDTDTGNPFRFSRETQVPVDYMYTTRKTPPSSNVDINVSERRSFIRTWHFDSVEKPIDIFPIPYESFGPVFNSYDILRNIIEFSNFAIPRESVDNALSVLSDKMSVGGEKLLDNTILNKSTELLDNTILNKSTKLLDNQPLILEIDKQLFDKFNQLNNIKKVFENPKINFIIYNKKIKGGSFIPLNKKKFNFKIKNRTKNRRKNKTKNKRKNKRKNSFKNKRKNRTKHRSKT